MPRRKAEPEDQAEPQPQGDAEPAAEEQAEAAEEEVEPEVILPPPPRRRRTVRDLARVSVEAEAQARHEAQIDAAARRKEMAIRKGLPLIDLGDGQTAYLDPARGQLIDAESGEILTAPPNAEPVEPPAFWPFAMEAGRSAETAKFRLVVSRVEPPEDERGNPLPLDHILTLTLPRDRESVINNIRAKHGGGKYECRIEDSKTGVVVTSTAGDEGLDIEGAPKGITRLNDPLIEARRELDLKKIRFETMRFQKEEEKLLGGGDSQGKSEVAEVLRLLVSRDNQAQLDRIQEQHKAELKSLEDRFDRVMDKLNERQQPAAPNVAETMLAPLINAFTTIATKPAGDGSTAVDHVIRGFELGMKASGGGGEEGGGNPLLAALPAMTPLLQMLAQKEAPAPQAQPLPAPAPQAALPPPQGGEPMTPIRQIAQLMLSESRSAKPPLPAEWIKMLYRDTADNPAALKQLLDAGEADLLQLLQREAPAELQQLGAVAMMRPAIRPWLDKNREILRKWNDARLARRAQAQRPPVIAPAPPQVVPGQPAPAQAAPQTALHAEDPAGTMEPEAPPEGGNPFAT